MIFIVNGERWISLIEAVKRSYQLYPEFYQRFDNPISCEEAKSEADINYVARLETSPYAHLPWNGAFYYEWSK